MWLISPVKKPDPSMSVNGILAGLVAITAPCAFVDSIGATIIGLIAGVIVCLAAAWLERVKVDDPVGAVPVHFFNGLWGLLSVGIFAKGLPETAGWNGIQSPVTGLLYGGGTQILAQVAEIGSIFIFVFGLSYVFFKVLNALKLLRSKPEDELAGLDIPEMGTPGYTTVDVRMAGGRLSQQVPVMRSTSPSVSSASK
jgi:Amt family ammonium transporter